jgi:serine/threonine-protein kinase
MGLDIDGRADQYALAATAYHLLTGSQLFPNSAPPSSSAATSTWRDETTGSEADFRDTATSPSAAPALGYAGVAYVYFETASSSARAWSIWS